MLGRAARWGVGSCRRAPASPEGAVPPAPGSSPRLPGHRRRWGKGCWLPGEPAPRAPPDPPQILHRQPEHTQWGRAAGYKIQAGKSPKFQSLTTAIPHAAHPGGELCGHSLTIRLLGDMEGKWAPSFSPSYSHGLELAAANYQASAGSETPVGGEPGDRRGLGWGWARKGWKCSGFLGNKRGSCFAGRLLRASHLGMHVCYSHHGESAQVQTSGSVLWHSQGGGCASPITCSPLVVLPPLHPRDYRSPLHPVPCGKKLQLRGPHGTGMGGWQRCGWAGCLGIHWIQSPGTLKLGALGKFLEVKPEKAERAAVTTGQGLLSFSLLCPCPSTGWSPAGLSDLSALVVTAESWHSTCDGSDMLVFGGVRGGTGAAAEGAASRAVERGEAVPSAVSSAPKCKANIAGSYETPGGKGPCLVPTPGPEDPAGKARVCPGVVSCVTVPAM